jgi:hypothetical protein
MPSAVAFLHGLLTDWALGPEYARVYFRGDGVGPFDGSVGMVDMANIVTRRSSRGSCRCCGFWFAGLRVRAF